MPDFEFDVGISVEEIRGDFEIIDESVRQLGSVVEQTTSSFIRMERQAGDLGLSMKELTGLSRETRDVYSNLVRTFQNSNELSVAAVEGFSGVADALNGVAISFLNAKSAASVYHETIMDQLGNEIEVEKERNKTIAFYLQLLQTGAELGRLTLPGGVSEALFAPDKLVRRPTGDEAERAATRRDAERFAAFAELRRAELPALISERTFLRLQGAEVEQVKPLSVLREEQSQQLRRFEIRQEGDRERRKLLGEKDSQEVVDSNDRIRAEIEGLRRDLGQRPSTAQVVEDI